MKVLSIKQPWPWAIMHAGKDIENRDWYGGHRGELAIHASKHVSKIEYCDAALWIERTCGLLVPAYTDLVYGAILGTVQMVGCVKRHDSKWFQGKFGFVLRDPKPFEVPIPARGALGFWSCEL